MKNHLIEMDCMTKLKKWQLAYIAGIIDGEGCFSLARQTNRRTMAAHVFVNMTNLDCIHFLHTTTTLGNFRTRQFENKKAQYEWSIDNRLEIYLLVEAIHPYLIVKREQADTMLEFVGRRINGRLVTQRDTELLEEMHKLNAWSRYKKGGI